MSTHTLEYGKTENLWRRNDTTHKLIERAWRLPHFPQIKEWIVTEKLDGMNGRLVLDWDVNEAGVWEERLAIKGRSEEANLPKDLLASFNDPAANFTDRLWRALQVITHGGESIEEHETNLRANPLALTVFGEFVGPGIQKNGADYVPEKTFRIFDVITQRVTLVDKANYPGETPCLVKEYGPPRWWWFDDVLVASDFLKIPVAPVLSYRATMDEAIEFVTAGLESNLAKQNGVTRPAEGIVARTDPYLFDARGERVMFKLKGKDLA